jgi:hypothetical protein
VREDEGRISLTLASDAVAVALPRLAELGVEGLRVAPPSLEELFLRHYGAPTPRARERGDEDDRTPPAPARAADAVSLAVWLAGLAALAAAGYPGVRLVR